MNFTWDALKAAQKALDRLLNDIQKWDDPAIGCAGFEEEFKKSVNDDLNMSKALAVLWELVNSDYPTSAKAQSLFKFDEVLGLNLRIQNPEFRIQKKVEIPEDIMDMIEEREQLRTEKRFHLADQLRNKIKKMGYDILDKEKGKPEIKKIY